MARILFAHPLVLAEDPTEAALSSPYFPLGLLYLAAYVRDAGHEVAIYDGTFEPDESGFATRLGEFVPDVLGISAVLPLRDAALRFADTAAARGIPVIAGGPDPTMTPDFYLAHPSIDVVVHHEGERTIAALLDLIDLGEYSPVLTAESLSSQAGVAFRDGDSIRVNPARPPIEDLDSLPLPARDLIDMSRYLDSWEDQNGYSSVTIATSRGCPHGCQWCADAVHGAGFRQRSPDSVAAEMQHLSENYAIGRLRVIDDVDAIDREWLEEWERAASAADAIIPFEALNDLKRQDIPLLDVRDSL